MSNTTLLKIADVSKRFGGLQALSGVSLTIEQGQIYGLIGPNGAGDQGDLVVETVHGNLVNAKR